MRLLPALAVLLLCGCASRPDRWKIRSASADRDVEAEWARYHWYIPAMTHEIRAKWVTENGYSGPWIKISMRMEAKALTQEGAAVVGALRFEHWKEHAATLAVSHWDSAGNPVPVPLAQVRKRFRQDGVVVVPRVAKGSTVSVYIVEGPFSALNHWELALDARVPVLRSEVRLTAPDNLGFAAHPYNGLAEPLLKSNGRFSSATRIWSADKVMPLADLPYADGMTARPRLLLLNTVNSAGTCYKDWSVVAKEKRKQEFATSLFSASSAAREQAKALAQGLEGAEKARRLLAWVQDNITILPEDPKRAGADAVLERRKGTQAQTASLLKAMYDAVGLPSSIVLSRPREWGGFDPAVPNPNAAAVPLVVARIGGRDWAAFPLSAAFAFGDYPDGFAGLQAMALETGSLDPLPELAHPQSRWESRQDVPLDGSPTRKAEVDLEGPWASELRAVWTRSEGGNPQDACRKWLKEMGFTAAVRACSAENPQDREKPLRLALTLDNAMSLVEGEGFQAWSVSNLFTRKAWFYDSSRVDPYLFPEDQIRKEKIRFLIPAGKKAKLDVPCGPVSNAVFKVACATLDSGTGFTRETVFRKGAYPTAALRAYHAELSQDREREARLTTR